MAAYWADNARMAWDIDSRVRPGPGPNYPLHNRLQTGGEVVVSVPKILNGWPLAPACWAEGARIAWDIYSYARVQPTGMAQIQSSLLYNRLWTSGDIVAAPKLQNGQPLTVSCWVDGVGTAWDINSHAQAQTSLSKMLIKNGSTNILQHTMCPQACINIWCIHKHVSTYKCGHR